LKFPQVVFIYRRPTSVAISRSKKEKLNVTLLEKIILPQFAIVFLQMKQKNHASFA